MKDSQKGENPNGQNRKMWNYQADRRKKEHRGGGSVCKCRPATEGYVSTEQSTQRVSEFLQHFCKAKAFEKSLKQPVLMLSPVLLSDMR